MPPSLATRPKCNLFSAAATFLLQYRRAILPRQPQGPPFIPSFTAVSVVLIHAELPGDNLWVSRTNGNHRLVALNGWNICLLSNFWATAWMDQDATWYKGMPRPGHIVLDGAQLPPPPAKKEKGTTPNFRPMCTVAKQSPTAKHLSPEVIPITV